MIAIYPEIEVRRTGKEIKLLTTLRKQHNGRWYFWDFVQRCYNLKDIGKAKEVLHKEVYNAIVLGKVSESLTDAKGELIFKEDPNQISETNRLKYL